MHAAHHISLQPLQQRGYVSRSAGVLLQLLLLVLLLLLLLVGLPLLLLLVMMCAGSCSHPLLQACHPVLVVLLLRQQ
jgi:hypothetical protein